MPPRLKDDHPPTGKVVEERLDEDGLLAVLGAERDGDFEPGDVSSIL